MRFQTISEKEVIELARQAKSDELQAICMGIEAIKDKGLTPSEGVMNEYNVAVEQFDELTDRLETMEESARKGGIGEMTRLKVEPKFGDWYYQKVNLYNEDEERYEHGYSLYEGDSYIGYFGNITAMKHYVRTGQRW